MVNRKVIEYVKAGSSPFSGWFSALDAHAAAKVATALYRLEQGNFSNVKSIGKGVSEYKIDFGPGYRIYFGQEGDERSSCWEAGPRRPSKKTFRSPTCFGRSISKSEQKRNEVIPCLLRVNSERQSWTVP